MEFVAGLGGSDRLQQQQGEGGKRIFRQDPEGPLHPLRHPRARHGGGDERIFLHGGFAPNGATFLIFTDYARPAMRLAALMGAGVVYVMTHDSIGLGEDGPTHQPVEHLAALRAIPTCAYSGRATPSRSPNAGSWRSTGIDGPTVLALTRQNLPQLRTSAPNDNPC